MQVEVVAAASEVDQLGPRAGVGVEVGHSALELGGEVEGAEVEQQGEAGAGAEAR